MAWDEKKALHAQFCALKGKTALPPYTFVVDASGQIVWHQDHSQMGATVPTFMTAMKVAVESALANEAVPSVGAKEVVQADDEESDEDGAGGMGDF